MRLTNRRVLDRAAMDNFEQIERALTTPPWEAILLTFPWANIGGAYETAGYRLEGSRVTMKGSVKGGATGSTIWTFPRSYRGQRVWPAVDRRVTTACVKGAGTLFPATLYISATTGAVNLYAPGAAGAIDELHLEVSFSL